MKNTLADLNNLLFEQMERLNDDELTDKEFEREMKKTGAMNKSASNVIDIAGIMLEVTKLTSEHRKTNVPKMLGFGKDEK